MVAKRLFGQVRQAPGGVILITDTPDVARDLEWFLQRYPMEMTDEVRAKLTAKAAARRQQDEDVLEILAGGGKDLPTEPARTPRDYQLAPAKIVHTTGRLLLTDDIGLGKTQSGLMVLAAPDAFPVLVVTLNGPLLKQWLRELDTVWPWLSGHILTKASPYDLKKARGNGGRDPDVIICNYTKLAGWADHLRGRVQTVIFDEMQELRRSDSMKYAAAENVASGAAYKIGLTNTPVWNYGGEMYNLISVLDPDALGSRDEFLREWCTSGYMDFTKAQVTDPKALGAHLQDLGIMLGRTRKEVGRELPDAIPIEIPVDADPKAIDAVAGSARELAHLLLDASSTRDQRWQAAGDLDWQLRQATGIAKAPYVAEFVRLLLDGEKKVVLYGWHHAVYGIWAQALEDLGVAMIHGKTSATQKEQAKEAFLTDPNCRVLIMSVRSGVGIDGLQEVAHVCVFGELDWSPQVHRQAIGRLRRDGQEEPVVAYFLHAEIGSDPTIMEVLDVKTMQADPMVRPDEDFEPQPKIDPTGRIRALAADVLRRAGESVPGAGPAPVVDLGAFPAAALADTPTAQPSLFD
jgi:superfamily II DNA or RNA helicase